MVAAPPPHPAPHIRVGPKDFRPKQLGAGDLSKKIKMGGGAKFKGGPMNPNDATVVVLKDILLCLLGFRFIYINYIS